MKRGHRMRGREDRDDHSRRDDLKRAGSTDPVSRSGVVATRIADFGARWNGSSVVPARRVIAMQGFGLPRFHLPRSKVCEDGRGSGAAGEIEHRLFVR